MDPLAPLLKHFALSARVFYSGTLCALADFKAEEGLGYLHVLRNGRLHVSGADRAPIEICEPSVLFYPRPCVHRFQSDEAEGAQLVCAVIDFGGHAGNPLLSALPDPFLAPMSQMAEIEATIALLFDEAFGARPGRQAAIDRLAEYCFLSLLRHLISHGTVAAGVLAGLADPRLGKAITAIHEKPEHAWSLEEMADSAAMSRARFAVRFRETVCMTPLDYVTDWRLCVARTLLRKGESLKLIAPAVGYSSSSALTKAFKKKMGLSPLAWMASQNE